MGNEKTARLTYRAVDKFTKPPPKSGIFELIAESYWVVHPERGIAFYDPTGRGIRSSPQCNQHKSIVERLCPDGHEVRYIAQVWLGHDCSEYVQ